MTLHPALQNFRVDIREAFAIPGTMCASVIDGGNHGISRLHVWVDFSFVPLGMAMVMGRVAICLFTTGAPSMMKWLVAPESETAHSTALVRNFRLKVVSRRFSCRLFACFNASHALVQPCRVLLLGCIFGVLGLGGHTLRATGRSSCFTMLVDFVLTLDVTTVVSSSSSSSVARILYLLV